MKHVSEREFEVFKIDTPKFKSLCIVDSEKVRNGENAVIGHINIGSDSAEIQAEHFQYANIFKAAPNMLKTLKQIKELFEGQELIDAGAVRRMVNDAIDNAQND